MQTARVYEPLHKRELELSKLEAIDPRQSRGYRAGEIDDVEANSWWVNLMIIALLLFIGWHMV